MRCSAATRTAVEVAARSRSASCCRLRLDLVAQLVDLRVVLGGELLLLGGRLALEPVDVLLDRLDQDAPGLGSDALALAHDRRSGDGSKVMIVSSRPCRRGRLQLLSISAARSVAATLPCSRRSSIGWRRSVFSVSRRSQLAIQVAGQLLDLLGVRPLLAADLGLDVLLDGADQPLALVLVDVDDDVLGEVQDLLEDARRHVEQQADAARRALDEPDVADRRGQLDVAHALAADLGPRDLDAALVADDALVADALVLAAVALPVLLGTEDALAEQAVALGLERAVVDGFRLGDLASRPRADLFGRGERDPDRVEIVDF